MKNEYRDLYEKDERGRLKLSTTERQRIIGNRMQGLNDDGTEKKSSDKDEKDGE